MTFRTTRRAALLGVLAAPAVLRRGLAQSAPIRFGALTPQTGAGGPYGPGMVKVIRAVAEDINAAGGVLGRKIEIVSEDDQTSPDAGVRAARKLIDVDKVCAIIGTWASGVTTAVAPLCWESKVMLFTVSGADSITKLPHQGYIIRTQPNSFLQTTRFGQHIADSGAKKVFSLAAQTPFAVDVYARLGEVMKSRGGDTLGQVVYDASKSRQCAAARGERAAAQVAGGGDDAGCRECAVEGQSALGAGSDAELRDVTRGGGCRRGLCARGVAVAGAEPWDHERADCAG